MMAQSLTLVASVLNSLFSSLTHHYIYIYIHHWIVSRGTITMRFPMNFFRAAVGWPGADRVVAGGMLQTQQEAAE
jgi:hypothetical protein